MLCDNCRENEAIISYTKMAGNNVEEVHLCPSCAEKKMREDLVFSQALTGHVDNFLKELFKLSGNFDKEIVKKKCSHCGTTFDELEKNHLGCEHCYEEFSAEISGMLKSLKYTATHKGKIPRSAGEIVINKRKREELRESLKKAVEMEEYEKAAVLRDELKALKD